MQNDLKQIIRACEKGKVKTCVLFGAYGKGEGALIDGKPVNDLDIVLVDADKNVQKAFSGITTSVPLDVVLVSSKDLIDIIPTQMWWEIRYGSILLHGEPLKLPNWKAWEIPFWDAVMSLDKRCVSMLIAKHEIMKKQPDFKKALTQIGKAVIALGDALLIKRGRFDHRYSVRSLMLMFDDIATDYRVAVSHKIFREPDLTPDEIWQLWMRTVKNLRTYITDNELVVPKLDLLLAINETTTKEEIAETIKKLGGERWI